MKSTKAPQPKPQQRNINSALFRANYSNYNKVSFPQSAHHFQSVSNQVKLVLAQESPNSQTLTAVDQKLVNVFKTIPLHEKCITLKKKVKEKAIGGCSKKKENGKEMVAVE